MDKRNNLEAGLGESTSAKLAWKATRSILGIKKNGGPTALELKNGQITKNPKKMATELNEFFIQKIKDLRCSSEPYTPTLDANRRLQSWLNKLQKPLPVFEIKEVTTQTLKYLA